MIRIFFASLLLLTTFACSHQPQKVAPGPVVHPPVPLSRIRSLEKKEIAVVKTQPLFQFEWKGRSFRVAHGTWKINEVNPDWNRMYGYGPVVWVTTPKETRVLDLRKEFPSHYVSHVFQDEFGGRIFLFLDYGVEGPAPVYNVWISEDSGETWFSGDELKRPPGSFPPANLENFFLNGRGQGTAWFRLEATYLPVEERPDGADSLNSEVFYRARTSDNGRSWKYESAPDFSSVLRQEVERHEE